MTPQVSLLPVALECIERGWRVFPCWPRTKKPMTHNGVLDASADEAQIRSWWTRCPDANIAIATGPSKLSVVDCDHGNRSESEAREWMARAGLPETYTVRTGRRINPKDNAPEYGVQLYYRDTMPGVGEFSLVGGTGQVKSLGGYVMAVGSIHPDSGEEYELITDAPVAPLPDIVRSLKTECIPVEDDGGPITESRNIRLTSIAGKLRNAGLGHDALEAALLVTNAARCAPPLDEEEVQRIACNAAKWKLPEHEMQVKLGGKTMTPGTVPAPEPEPVDWRTRYLTFEQVRDAKPTSFLIEGFLALDSITAVAAPVGQRKSLIALNVAHALVTGEPLFDYFEVAKKPERVVYLCPEMGLSSFSTRLKGIGLLNYVGRTLFCQTMDDTSVQLRELSGELPGAVVIIDTLTRFVEGDQNSSEDMSKFAKEVFRLKRCGATVLLLHHSIKGSSGTITLDSAMRGSTELAAFVTSCWATRLENPDDPYHSPSLLVNVKQRDFESKSFRATSDKTGRMRIVGAPGELATIRTQDTEAEKIVAALLKDSPRMGVNKVQAALRAAGHGKGVKWVNQKRAAILGTGVTVSHSPTAT
jgi:hypothetical protein